MNMFYYLLFWMVLLLCVSIYSSSIKKRGLTLGTFLLIGLTAIVLVMVYDGVVLDGELVRRLFGGIFII